MDVCSYLFINSLLINIDTQSAYIFSKKIGAVRKAVMSKLIALDLIYLRKLAQRLL